MRTNRCSCRSANATLSHALALVIAALVSACAAAPQKAAPGYGGAPGPEVSSGTTGETGPAAGPGDELQMQQPKTEEGPTTTSPPGAVAPPPAPGGEPARRQGGEGGASAVPLVQREEEEERMLLAAFEGAKTGTKLDCASVCGHVAALQRLADEGCQQTVSSGNGCAQGKAKAANMATRAQSAGCPCAAPR